ncbi:ORF2 [Fowl aviadenovirus 4]|nr:ORF2 [Fowl aviadenovirus 4]
MASDRYWDLVNSLINRGIVTREQWQSADLAEYRRYSKGYVRGFSVRKVLRDVIKHMCWTKVLGDYLVCPVVCQDDIHLNPFYVILMKNGYNPRVVGTILHKWSMLTSNKNTVWVWGGAETGGPYLAEAIAYTSPVVGCVGWRNRANPFARNYNCLVYWLDGGLFPESAIGLCEQVLRGEGTMVEVEEGATGERRWREINRTPVLISTSHDVTLTYVKYGQTCKDHTNSLRSAMYVLRLTERVEPGFVITCNDARKFVTWASNNPHINAEDML